MVGPTHRGATMIDPSPPGAAASDDLTEAKRRLRDAAGKVDLLAPLRRNPFTTVGAAAVLGVVAASPAAARIRTGRTVVTRAGALSRLLTMVGRSVLAGLASGAARAVVEAPGPQNAGRGPADSPVAAPPTPD
mgnify:CR=1 FL=1